MLDQSHKRFSIRFEGSQQTDCIAVFHIKLNSHKSKALAAETSNIFSEISAFSIKIIVEIFAL